MNAVRALSAASAGLLAAFVAWAAVTYDGGARPVPYLLAAATAVAVLLAPAGAARAKLLGKRALRHVRGGSEFSAERGTVFRATSPLGRADLFDAVEEVVGGSGDFEGVRTDEFPEGEGLVVTHAGFHALFVRVTDAGHPVVTGASKRTRRLVDALERTRSLSFERVETSPFLDPEPVRGGPRVLLAGALVVATLGGATVVVDAAHAGEPYNTAEKFTLVGTDARAAIDPGVSETEAKLHKAAFLVRSIREEAVEIRWQDADAERVHGNAVQALRTDRTVRELLRSARSASLTAEQAARADRIETALLAADRRVAAAVRNRTGTGLADPDGDLDEVRRRLAEAGETPVAPAGPADDDPGAVTVDRRSRAVG